MDSANVIIANAIEALRGEAQAIEAKIAALESSLSLEGTQKAPRGRPKKTPAKVAIPLSTRKRKTRGKAKGRAALKSTQTKVKLQTAAEKRSKSWDATKKAAAAERMRKYWAKRKKQG